jgi:ribose-phosphate pyrophosphokinase
MPIELLNGKFETFAFSGGEIHVRVTEHNPLSNIRAILKTPSDIMTLLLLADALKRLNSIIVSLEIPYFPYARQDRVCNKGESLAVKVMADLINGIGAERVSVADPHSDVMCALINNCQVINVYYSLKKLIGDKLIICPDAGAEKRISKLQLPYVMATKVRDPMTGQILRTQLYDESGTVRDRACLIVDDICDGGRTFTELAKVLRDHGAASVELYVTHGIFSKGLEVFKGLINNVYNYDYNTGEIICTRTME